MSLSSYRKKNAEPKSKKMQAPLAGPFLILQHTDTTDPGSTLEWLKTNNLKYTLLRSQVLPQLNSLPEFEHLITLGGSMNVDEEALHPWMKNEKKLIEAALGEKKKVLGLCLGAQMIADVLGSKVEKNKHWEIGWHEVEINPKHPLLKFSTEKLLAFQFHQYHFQTPKNAFKFASNLATENQGYIYDDIAVATQFHPESTKSWVEYCATCDLRSGEHCQTKEQILAQAHAQADLQQWYYQLLNSFFLAT